MAGERDADVLVVGYGPVGATIAALLGNAGLRVLVIDREQDVYRLPRAVATDDDALRVWDTIPGLADALRAEMLESLPVAYLNGKRTLIEVETGLKETPSRFPPFALFHQPSLERALRDAARGTGMVTEALGVELIGFEEDRHRVVARVREVAGGSERDAEVGWLLGCDGASSGVRTELGADFGGSTFAEKWVVADTKVHRDRPGSARVEFICNPARPSVTMPMPGGRRRWEFMLFPEDDEVEMTEPQRLDRLIESVGGDRPDSYERRVVYTFHARVASSWGAGRVYLLGDAAHVTPPFAGQGMTSGIRDAGNLWWKLASVEAGVADDSLLVTYEQERRAHTQAMIDLAVRLGGIVQTPSAFKARVRDTALRLAWLVPGVKAWARRMGWKPDTRVLSGFLTRGGRRPRHKAGLPFPSPEVVVAGKRESLDEAIGPRFAVISAAPDPLSELEPDELALAQSFGAVAVTLAGEAAPGVIPVEDSTGVLEEFLAGGTAIVRPDRFVYGLFRS